MDQTVNGVMMLLNSFPPLPTGGAEHQAERLSTYLAHQNMRVGVLTRRVGKLAKYECKDGFEIYRLPQIGPGKMKTFTFTLSAIFTLLRFSSSYDILHAHLAFSPAVAAAVAGKLLGKRVVVKFGNSDAFGDIQRSQKTWRGRLRLNILRHWTDVCIALDAMMENEILTAGFLRERVIRMDNAIDAQQFVPCLDKSAAKKRLDLMALENKVVALFVGRLTSQKALPVLLHAMRRTLLDSPNLHLLILGQGEEAHALVELAAELGLQQNVTFVGYIDDVRPYFDVADLFVLPSLAEGVSNSLLEAMSCGLACIATPVGGSAEVLSDGDCGLLVPPGNMEALANCLIRLSSDSNERIQLGTRARQRILDRYDIRIVGSRYHHLYQSLIEAK
jgi:glycosyltransferase involved in cell wall biosynthesis